MLKKKKNVGSPFDCEGILKCARYAFMPNKLSFCGPDKNRDLLHYCQTEEIDRGLNLILEKFQTLYPYLKLIARANRIRDPFDQRVIEAYWIGNELLENINKSALYNYLIDEQQLKKKLSGNLLRRTTNKVALGAKPHHSFHVLNVWKKAGDLDEAQTLSAMDLCRISWGEIKNIEKPYLEVKYHPLVLEKDELKLGSLIPQRVLFEISDDSFIKEPQVGQWISFHWGFACELLNKTQIAYLKKYTQESICLVNN